MMVPFELRHISPFRENHDCTVCALANVTGITYDEAHRVLAAAGRKPRKGFQFRKFVKAHQNTFAGWRIITTEIPEPKHKAVTATSRYGFEYQRWIRGSKYTLQQFVNAHPEGRYVVRVHRHVLAVVNGVAIDSFKTGTRSHVSAHWRFERIQPSANA